MEVTYFGIFLTRAATSNTFQRHHWKWFLVLHLLHTFWDTLFWLIWFHFESIMAWFSFDFGFALAAIRLGMYARTHWGGVFMTSNLSQWHLCTLHLNHTWLHLNVFHRICLIFTTVLPYFCNAWLYIDCIWLYFLYWTVNRVIIPCFKHQFWPTKNNMILFHFSSFACFL